MRWRILQTLQASSGRAPADKSRSSHTATRNPGASMSSSSHVQPFGTSTQEYAVYVIRPHNVRPARYISAEIAHAIGTKSHPCPGSEHQRTCFATTSAPPCTAAFREGKSDITHTPIGGPSRTGGRVYHGTQKRNPESVLAKGTPGMLRMTGAELSADWRLLK